MSNVAPGIVATVVLLCATSSGSAASRSNPLPTPAQEVPPHVVGSLVERDAAPTWLQLPPSAQVEIPPGVALEVISTSILSEERRKEAVLVGLFRNTGRLIKGATLTLSFIGRDGAIAGSALDNDAKVSEVATNEFLPFRFPLTSAALPRSDLTAVRLTLAERATDIGRPIPATLVRYAVRGAARNSTVVTGRIDVSSTEAAGAQTRLVATILLLDKDDRCVEILTGELARSTGNSYPFEFHSPLPVGKSTRHTRVWVEGYGQ